MNILSSVFPPQPEEAMRYSEVPPEAPQPRIWKCLGHVAPGLEMHYALETFGGDLDVDRESEMRVELCSAAQLLNNNGALRDGLVLAQQFGRRHLVRFIACSCGTNLYTTRN